MPMTSIRRAPPEPRPHVSRPPPPDTGRAYLFVFSFCGRWLFFFMPLALVLGAAREREWMWLLWWAALSWSLTSWYAKIKRADIDDRNLSAGQGAHTHYPTALSDAFGICCSSALVVIAVLVLTGKLQ